MVIAFYPGAGGNRYQRLLLGKDWNKLNVSYDRSNSGQLSENRYLLNGGVNNNISHILTHCMNRTLITQLFPNRSIVFIKSNLQQCLRREWALAGHKQFMHKKIKNDVARLDHYRSIKDPTWPMVHTIKELDQLPNEILREVSIDYDKVINNVVDVPDQLTQLTHTLIDKVNSSYEIIKWHLDYYQKYPVEFSQDDQIIDIDHGVYEFSILMKTELNLYQSEIFDQVWDKING
jgi:hypothetical protein